MKFLLALLLFTQVASAQVFVLRGQRPASATCSTARDSITGTTASSSTVGNTALRTYVATRFTAAASTTICKAVLRMDKVGSPTFNVTVSIWTHDGVDDDPETLIGVASGVVASSSFATSEADVEFTGISAAITSSTVYWVVVQVSALGDASHHIRWYNISESATDLVMGDGDGVGPWVNVSSVRHAKFQLYSQ